MPGFSSRKRVIAGALFRVFSINGTANDIRVYFPCDFFQKGPQMYIRGRAGAGPQNDYSYQFNSSQVCYTTFPIIGTVTTRFFAVNGTKNKNILLGQMRAKKWEALFLVSKRSVQLLDIFRLYLWDYAIFIYFCSFSYINYFVNNFQ